MAPEEAIKEAPANWVPNAKFAAALAKRAEAQLVNDTDPKDVALAGAWVAVEEASFGSTSCHLTWTHKTKAFTNRVASILRWWGYKVIVETRQALYEKSDVFWLSWDHVQE